MQLSDILWQLDRHHKKFAMQTCPVPEFFSKFQKYNLPESYKRRRPNFKCESVSSMSQQLFNTLQQVSVLSLILWLAVSCMWSAIKSFMYFLLEMVISTRWVDLKKAIEQLAECLHKYSKYLEAQNEKIIALQHAFTPACSICDAVALFTLPIKDLHTSSTIHALLPICNALKDKQYYAPLFLNDLIPNTARDCYHFIQNLKENGCQLDAVLFTYSTGNNKGNYHFL